MYNPEVTCVQRTHRASSHLSDQRLSPSRHPPLVSISLAVLASIVVLVKAFFRGSTTPLSAHLNIPASSAKASAPGYSHHLLQVRHAFSTPYGLRTLFSLVSDAGKLVDPATGSLATCPKYSSAALPHPRTQRSYATV
jgi:hypothetical protein